MIYFLCDYKIFLLVFNEKKVIICVEFVNKLECVLVCLD